MKRWSRFFQIIVLTWALHRIAMAIIGFPMFSFSSFNLGEFAWDVGVYIIAFFISYWFVTRIARLRDQNPQ